MVRTTLNSTGTDSTDTDICPSQPNLKKTPISETEPTKSATTNTPRRKNKSRRIVNSHDEDPGYQQHNLDFDSGSGTPTSESPSVKCNRGTGGYKTTGEFDEETDESGYEMVDNMDSMDADWDGDDEDSTDYDSLGVATLGEHNAKVMIQESAIMDLSIKLRSASIDTHASASIDTHASADTSIMVSPEEKPWFTKPKSK